MPPGQYKRSTALLLALTKSTARCKKPLHIFFRMIDWLFVIDTMNVFISSISHDKACSLMWVGIAHTLYSLCTVDWGYNLNIADKRSSSVCENTCDMKSRHHSTLLSSLHSQFVLFFCRVQYDVSVTNCNSGRKCLYRFDVIVCDVAYTLDGRRRCYGCRSYCSHRSYCLCH